MEVAFYEGFGAGANALGKGESLSTSQNGNTTKGDLASKLDAAPIIKTRAFAYQSYFDLNLLYQAVLEQPSTALIVPSTLKDETVSGYTLGLSPASQTPIAMRFNIGGSGNAGSQVMVLKPGQTVRPFGRERFVGFTWGLPQGWLGGGLATIHITQSPEAEIRYLGEPQEVLFHRQTMTIAANNTLTAATVIGNNWPTVFPWAANTRKDAITNVVYYQDGQPTLAVQPTRTLLRVSGPLAATLNLAALIQTASEFDDMTAGSLEAFEFTIPAFTPPDLGGVAQQVLELPPIINRLGTNGPRVIVGGIRFVQMGALAEPPHIDVIRYGRL